MNKKGVIFFLSIILSFSVFGATPKSYCTSMVNASKSEIIKLEKNATTLNKQIDKVSWLSKSEKNVLKIQIRDKLSSIKKQHKNVVSKNCKEPDGSLTENEELLNEQIRKTYYALINVNKNIDLTMNEKKDLFNKIYGDYLNEQN